MTFILEVLLRRWLLLLDDKQQLLIRANLQETIASGTSHQLAGLRDRPDTICQDNVPLSMRGAGEEKSNDGQLFEARDTIQRYSRQMPRARHGSAGFRMAYATAGEQLLF